MNELIVAGEDTGSTIYAVLRRDSDDYAWSTVAGDWVAYANADYANYTIALTETPSGSRFWVGDQPADSKTATVNAFYYRQSGGSPSYSADEIVGTEVLLPEGSTGTAATTGLITIPQYKRVVTTTASDLALQFLINAASTAIQNYCGFTFVSESRTEYLSGEGYNFLQLGARPSTFTAVTEDPEGSTPTTISTTNFGYTEHGLMYFKPSSTGGCGYFVPGFRNYKVEYTSYGVVPYDLQQACILVVAAFERQADPDLLVTEKTLGNRKVKYDNSLVFDPNDPVFGQARVLLAPYVVPLCL